MSLPCAFRFSVPLAWLLIAVRFSVAQGQPQNEIRITELPPIEAPITSFGAGIADGYLYVYGGHLGAAHKYSADQQAKRLLRLNLAKADQWEVVSEVPPRTGLAMVSYGGYLYRIGGWVARNAAGADWDLYSSRDFSRYDPKTGQWHDLEPLPTGRSSHDAAVLGSQLYVIGGWELSGGSDGVWHETAYVCDLSQDQPQWKEIAKPPFNRRAIAVAAYRGKIYVIGGMDDANDATTATNIYDPQSNRWSEGPAMPGKGFDGFGTSAIGAESGLYATTSPGRLYRLSGDGKSWEEIGKLNHPRMFHRLIAESDNKLVVVGGTSRGGKVKQVESLQLNLTKSEQ